MASPTQDDDFDDEDDDDPEDNQVPIAVALAANKKKADDKRKKPRKNLAELKRQSEANQEAAAAAYVSEATRSFDQLVQKAKATMAANTATAEAVAAAAAQPVRDIGSKKRRGRPKGSKNTKGVTAKPPSASSANYSLLEDICIAKAYASVTLDPVVGTNQKAEDFWKKVHDKYHMFMEKEDKLCLESHPRSPSSLRERFNRNIQKQVNVFNAVYIGVKKVVKSGWQDEDYMKSALQKYLEASGGKPFEYEKCLPFLWKVPKFDVTLTLVHAIASDESSMADHSKVGAVQGSTLTRPQGSKAAKRAVVDASFRIAVEKRRASSDKEANKANKLVSLSMNGINNTIAKQRLDDQRTNLINWYMKSNMMDEAKRLMDEVAADLARDREEMMAKLAAKSAAQSATTTNNPPDSVAINRANSSPASDMSLTTSPGTHDALADVVDVNDGGDGNDNEDGDDDDENDDGSAMLVAEL